MDLPVRKKLPHTIPQWVAEGSWFFITIKCLPPGRNQLCQMDGGPAGRVTPCAPMTPKFHPGGQGTARPAFARPTVGEGVLAAMAHNHNQLVWHCRLCLLMPDHLHAIMAFPREPGMATLVANWKKFAAVKLGVKWQRDFFDHRLRDVQELEEKTSYILLNPVRKGLCGRAEDWVWIYRPNDRPPPLPA
jgi:REP element-mobilizing transposase RayT